MKFHVICGMPRAGSTLFCNVLNQNPDFYASSTSPLAQTTRTLGNLWSTSPEVKGDLIRDPDETTERMVRSSRALVEAWYEGKGSVVFDKGRLWNHNPLVLHQVFPEAKILVCVRDLRDIFASIEKQHAKNPLLDVVGNPIEGNVYHRADQLLSPNGLVGQQVEGVTDLLRRRLPYVHMISYEALSQNPRAVMERVYQVIDEPYYSGHDFENVENTATDVDGLYLNKFPHEGSGKIEPNIGQWQEHVPADIAQLIMQRFAGYNQAFGYY